MKTATTNKRTIAMLKELQTLTLPQKIDHAIGAIEQFCNKTSNPVISFSGGKDSTVLMHITRELLRKNIPAIFINTGNEYPEIVRFATKKYKNTTTLHPKLNIKTIIEKYGFPLISKEIAKMIYELKKQTKHSQRYITGIQQDGKKTMFTLPLKYHFLLHEKFNCSDKCCNFLKKQPIKNYDTITAEMTTESILREKAWLRTGCNSFGTYNKSKPLSIWTESDIQKYKNLFNLEFAEIYENPTITRTGCMFCGFGIHLEHISRFEFLLNKYPKVYKFFLQLKNNDITYQQAINRCGIILPNQSGYQTNIFNTQSI